MKKFIIISVLFFMMTSTRGQITGLWEVTKVDVGQETMTPVARWFQLNEDKTMQSGNGGIHHSRGTYVITPDNSVLIFTDEYGKTDPYGAFRVTLASDKMIWERMEDGQFVTVNLEKTDNFPKGPWDQAIGNWKLVESTEHEEVADQGIFLRWDREYRAQNGLLGDNDRGIWQIAAQHPQLRLVSFNDELPDQVYNISFFKDYRMIWASNDESVKLVFDRNLE